MVIIICDNNVQENLKIVHIDFDIKMCFLGKKHTFCNRLYIQIYRQVIILKYSTDSLVIL